MSNTETQEVESTDTDLDALARELGYTDWSAVPRVPRNMILGSLDDGVTADDRSLAELAADVLEA